MKSRIAHGPGRFDLLPGEGQRALVAAEKGLGFDLC